MGICSGGVCRDEEGPGSNSRVLVCTGRDGAGAVEGFDGDGDGGLLGRGGLLALSVLFCSLALLRGGEGCGGCGENRQRRNKGACTRTWMGKEKVKSGSKFNGSVFSFLIWSFVNVSMKDLARACNSRLNISRERLKRGEAKEEATRFICTVC
mmetsp:Transcript_13101/g.25701  ORF Transcript_13101/g.25701 Transcript_13101/m.25701 type:complete len:153 (-) Transcript_13101:464-922(-)